MNKFEQMGMNTNDALYFREEGGEIEETVENYALYCKNLDASITIGYNRSSAGHGQIDQVLKIGMYRHGERVDWPKEMNANIYRTGDGSPENIKNDIAQFIHGFKNFIADKDWAALKTDVTGFKKVMNEAENALTSFLNRTNETKDNKSKLEER